jgi:hypothetical protein
MKFCCLCQCEIDLNHPEAAVDPNNTWCVDCAFATNKITEQQRSDIERIAWANGGSRLPQSFRQDQIDK